MIAFKIVDRTAIASLERRQVHGFGEVVSELNYAGWVSQSAGIFDIRHMCVCVNGTDLFQTRTRILMATRLRTYLVCASTLISQSKSQTNNKLTRPHTHTNTHTQQKNPLICIHPAERRPAAAKMRVLFSRNS